MVGRRGLNRKLSPPVGSLLRTLVRLFFVSIGPRHDVAVRVFFNWMCKDDASDERFF